MFWHIYNYLACIAIFVQLLFIIQMYKNQKYAIKKASKTDHYYHPTTLLTVPCKGLDSEFEKNITSHFKLDYDDYYLHFVVESDQDPAYEKLCQIKNSLESSSKARYVKILTAGLASASSQKIHNLLCSCANAPKDTEVFAFADSDACLKQKWLKYLVHPLRKEKHGASTGYRWFVPQKNNLASLVQSAINGKVAQLLGNTQLNQAWGGSMAIRKDTFYDINLDKTWQKAISDDLALSRAVRKAHKKIIFVPACLVASYEHTTWPALFEFVRRQFIITRIYTPSTWFIGLASSIYSLAGLWFTAAVAVCAGLRAYPYFWLYLIVPVIFLSGQTIRALLRRKMITEILAEDSEKMKPAFTADILGNSIWSWVLFICIVASAFGKTITWRNIRYRLDAPDRIVILDK